MDYAMFADYIAKAMMVIGILVVITNIIVEVLKALLPKVPTNYLAMGVAMLVTLLAFFAWMGYRQIVFVWYYIIAALILGMMVAYAAMFGFDKLKEAFEWLKRPKAVYPLTTEESVQNAHTDIDEM